MGNGIIGWIIGGMGGFIGGVAITLIAVLALGYFTTGGVNIQFSMEHSTVANSVSASDKTDNKQLTLKHVLTTYAEHHPNAPQDLFTPRKSYTESLWTFCSGNDIDITMTIWGPGNDGKSYMLEFGRHGGNAMQIKVSNQTVDWASGGTVGYASLTVTAG